MNINLDEILYETVSTETKSTWLKHGLWPRDFSYTSLYTTQHLYYMRATSIFKTIESLSYKYKAIHTTDKIFAIDFRLMQLKENVFHSMAQQ